MQRRSFIKIAGITSLGLYIGSDLLAIQGPSTRYKLININDPVIHPRHGMFNLHSGVQKGKKIWVQRDVFTGNGLGEVSNDRITSIKINVNQKEVYGVFKESETRSKSNEYNSIHLSKNSSKAIAVDSPSLIFAEFHELEIDGNLISKQTGILVNSPTQIDIISSVNQHVIIYQLPKNDNLIKH